MNIKASFIPTVTLCLLGLLATAFAVVLSQLTGSEPSATSSSDASAVISGTVVLSREEYDRLLSTVDTLRDEVEMLQSEVSTSVKEIHLDGLYFGPFTFIDTNTEAEAIW